MLNATPLHHCLKAFVLIGLTQLSCAPPEDGDEKIGTSSAALESNCPSSALGIYNVCSNATNGSGTQSSPWTGWEASLNAVAAGGSTPVDGGPTSAGGGGREIYFPAGYYTLGTQIRLRPGWAVRGAGMMATWISTTTTFDADAFLLQSPINSSSDASVRVEDLTLINANSSASTAYAAVDIVGATYVDITRIQASAFGYGVIFDQAEVSDVYGSNLAGELGALWLCNGADHSPGARGGFTNVINIRDNNFEANQPTSFGIIDDGGVSHVIDGNNFVGGGTQIRTAGTVSVTIAHNYFESAGNTVILGSTTTRAGTNVSVDVNLNISDNQLESNAHAAIALASPYQANINNNFFDSTVPAITGVNTVGILSAVQNYQESTGATFDSSTNGNVGTVAGMGFGTSAPTQEVEVNGGIRLNTVKTQPTCSSSTRGTFWSVQGAAGVKDEVQVCAKDAADAYAWRVLY